MLKLLGFIVAWPISLLVITMVLNTVRAKAGVHINDHLTLFMQGMVFPPFAILGSLSREASASGKRVPMLLGGFAGTIAAILLYRAVA